MTGTLHEHAFAVAGIIVGAGAGKRFGGPKAIATLSDGRRFVDAIFDTARDAELSPVVTVLPPGVEPPKGSISVVNAKADGEQVVSLRLGLAQLANHPVVGVVAWPVDHPFVTLESVLALIDAARRTGAPIVSPEFDGRHGHPVFFHRDTWRELMTVADGGARAVVRSYGSRVARVDVHDRGVLRDIDLPSDLASD